MQDETQDELENEWYAEYGLEEYSESRFGDNRYILTPSDFTEFALVVPSRGTYRQFSFEGRSYLRQIYDTPASRRIVMAGRQVEKSQVISSGYVVSSYGELVPLKDVVLQQELISVAMPVGAKTSVGQVCWISRRYTKLCLRIRTRQGHEIEVATTHPMRLWGRWVEAKHLNPGDRLAVIRRGGKFGNKKVVRGRIELTAYMIADGSLGQPNISITKGPGSVQRELLRLLDEVGMTHRKEETHSSPAFHLHKGLLHEWLEEDGLLGCLSPQKFVPNWVFQLSKTDTARFINRLWACDGHVKKISESEYDIIYSSISLRLVRQVQALLWKFGIPSGYRSYIPDIYEGTDKVHHLIQVETQEGIRCFLTEIGALGKSEDVPLPDKEENNNRDTYPVEINKLLGQIVASHPNYSSKNTSKLSLHAAGLRRKLKYPPTKEKLRQYLEFFKKNPGFDADLVAHLEAHLETDLYWDEIVGIEDIGEQECIDFMVEEHHNFVANGFVTHNSTLLGNQILAYCALNTGFRALYVSPSHQQTKVFSRDRIKEPIDTSTVLRKMTTSRLLTNVLEKKFANRSQVTLRFAFLNADRCLGGDSRIQLADGSLVAIKDLVGLGPVDLIAADKHGYPVRAVGSNARSTGIRKTVRVHTSYPVSLECTLDHRILTNEGWVEAAHLKKGDFIASLHPYRLFDNQSMGEGHALELGEFGASQKCLPASIFKATLYEKAAFLQALFRGDGWRHTENGRAEYCTSFQKLAEDIGHLLWGLGIRSFLRRRYHPTHGVTDLFILDFSALDTACLEQLIGEYQAKKIKDNSSAALDVPFTSWIEVRNVEMVGEQEVFDLTVEGPENFQANGLIVHNCRGIPADYVCIDEFQDIVLDNVPVIEECASHSSYKLFTYSGTPKSLDNPLEFYYRRFSTQNEWVVPCRAHGTPNDPSSWYWNVLEEDNIGKSGLICSKCDNKINAADPSAMWASLNPNPNIEKPFEGFRIPQIMVPWIEWEDILDKQRKYSRPKFFNEVLGLSYDSGVRPLTVTDISDNCNPELSMSHYRRVAEQYSGDTPIFMGIDWGCHDDQTRILTASGFKYFKDLTDDDQVAQFDEDTREMSFVTPQVRTVRDWDGELLHFQSRSLDMMLTPTHRMLTKCQSATQWSVERAGETVKRGGQVYFRGSVRWSADEVETWTLPGLSSSADYPGSDARTFRMDDWLEFLGYFLSEGGFCMAPDATGVRRPTCLKMSQRETINPENTAKIRACMGRLGIDYQECPNEATGDVNWTICGKQFWAWVENSVGSSGSTKRIPREFMNLGPRQLRILFDAMMLGDGSEDLREGNFNGVYYSTSKELCEDFQELCIRLGLRATVSLHKPAEGSRKDRYRLSWSAGDDHVFKNPSENVEHVSYKGQVYCCKVPTGFIVTERNGSIAYQGNSGENTFTVMSLGGYLPWDPGKFTIFYIHRFEGPESEPRRQLDIIKELVKTFNVAYIGADYGGGHWPNDELLREYGFERVKKYQWVGNVKSKIKYETRLTIPRYLCHRTETMSDIFNAIKRKDVFRFPRWSEFQDPYALDMLNIFSEYNDRIRMNVYKHAPGMPDDSFHSIVFCFLVSFHYRRRPDVVAPTKESEREANQQDEDKEELDIDL